MATIMSVFGYEGEKPDEEKYYIDFSVFKGITQRHKFKELQRIAFSKDIGWWSTGKCIEAYNMLANNIGGDKIIVCFQSNSKWRRKYLAYGKEGEPITYRELIKKLRAL